MRGGLSISTVFDLNFVLNSISSTLAGFGGKSFVLAGWTPKTSSYKKDHVEGSAIIGEEVNQRDLLKSGAQNYAILECELAQNQISVDLFLHLASTFAQRLPLEISFSAI